MKNFGIAGMALLLVAIIPATFLASCQHGYSTSINTSPDDEGRSVTTIEIRKPGVSELIKYTGSITLNDAETAIDSLSPEGYVRYIKNNKQLLATCSPQGQVTYALSDGGQALALDESGKRFIASALREMIGYGFNASGRVERLYKQGGVRAVLNETDNMQWNELRLVYFEYLLNIDSLSTTAVTAVAQKIGVMQGSDFEKERLLRKFSPTKLQEDQTMQAWLGAIGGMGSDMQKESLLMQLIDKDTIASAALPSVLDAIEHIGSDMAKENLLARMIDKSAISQVTLHGDNLNKVFTVIGHIGSDMTKENLFRQMIDKDVISGDVYSSLFTAIGHFGSDMAKENLLMQVINKDTIPASHFDELIGTIGHMGSDQSKENLLANMINKKAIPADHFIAFLHEVSRIGNQNTKVSLLSRLAEQPITDEDQWIGLLDAASTVDFDNAKSDLLTDMARRMPASEKVKAAYMRAVKTIHSDAQYGRAVKALE